MSVLTEGIGPHFDGERRKGWWGETFGIEDLFHSLNRVRLEMAADRIWIACFDYTKSGEPTGFTVKTQVTNDEFVINLVTFECFQFLDGGGQSFQLDGNTIENLANKIQYLTLTDSVAKQYQ